MELKQKVIHQKYEKKEARSQITIGDDYSIPEGKPDISALLQKKAEIRVDEVHTETGKIRIHGTLKLWVLYVTERSGETLSNLLMEFPFDEILYMEGAVSGDQLKIDWNIEELGVMIIHPGKLSVRALVALQGLILGTEASSLTERPEERSDLCIKQETFPAAEPVLEKKDSYRVRDEVLLPANKPNVQEILWKDLQVRGLDLRQQEGRLAVKGEILLFVVYRSEDDQLMIQWYEQTIPFQGTTEVEGLTQEMFGVPEAEIVHQEIELKPDYDGELRMFQIDLLLDISMHFYEEHTCSVLSDLYSTKEQLSLQMQELSYERLRMCTQTKCRVSGHEHLEEGAKILQILSHQVELRQKQSQITKEGIQWEGILEVQVLYITDHDSQPFGSAAFLLPCSQLIEIPEIQKEDRWILRENVEQLFLTMPEENQLEVRGVIGLNVCVMEQCRRQNITAVTGECYDPEAEKKRPGILIHFVQPKETLWDIAKANHTTMEEIRKLNELPVEDVVPGQKLLLLKQREGCLLG